MRDGPEGVGMPPRQDREDPSTFHRESEVTRDRSQGLPCGGSSEGGVLERRAGPASIGEGTGASHSFPVCRRKYQGSQESRAEAEPPKRVRPPELWAVLTVGVFESGQCPQPRGSS